MSIDGESCFLDLLRRGYSADGETPRCDAAREKLRSSATAAKALSSA
jgi:hypothetical protein